MKQTSYQSWGRYPNARQTAIRPDDRTEPLLREAPEDASLLPFGNGRSYGDSCQNDGGVLIDCRGLNRIVSFDTTTGILRAEAGILFSDLLAKILPKGWFLPVTPGTQFITLGGAVANDIHGKNHHCAGTFGRHVRCFELLRSDGSRTLCSPTRNTTLFRATIGGMGLTGLITWAEVQLKPVASAEIDQDVIRFDNLDGFFDLSEQSSDAFEYTVAWVDSLATGTSLGRGLFMRGNHAKPQTLDPEVKTGAPIDFPIDPPFSLLNRWSLRAFNTLYYRKQLAPSSSARVPHRGFFYPLDRIGKWYRLYGPKGLLQHQCVVPKETGRDAIREMLELSARSGSGSFLTVLKEFGDLASPGLLSFPRPGTTLTLDFPNQGDRTFALLNRLDDIVMAAGGAVNPYKDARMSATVYQRSFPDWRDLEHLRDPRFSSSFWRRVTGTSASAGADKKPSMEAAQ